MGSKILSALSYASLSIQAWKFMTSPYNLITLWPHASSKLKTVLIVFFINSTNRHNRNHEWGIIWNSKFIVRSEYRWSIRSSESIMGLDHQWLYGRALINNTWKSNPLVANLKLYDIILNNGKRRNNSVIYTMFEWNEATQILQILFFKVIQDDKVIWEFIKNDIFIIIV